MSLLLKGGIRKLSELEIDANKDWQGKGITNLARVASDMQIGHIVQHNGVILETLPPGIPTHVLTSEGPAHEITWAPGGLYLWRYFPVEVGLSFVAGLFSPSYAKDLEALLAAPFGIEDRINPAWFKRLEPSLSSIRSVGLCFAGAPSKRSTDAMPIRSAPSRRAKDLIFSFSSPELPISTSR